MGNIYAGSEPPGIKYLMIMDRYGGTLNPSDAGFFEALTRADTLSLLRFGYITTEKDGSCMLTDSGREALVEYRKRDSSK